ncbi:MAG: Flp pilus assembly complex ATPase component TadA [Armatimonadetes bacterium]|nr:Flp pilus assembly complex ATPase component TadA [Armatimonadota bacterium]
MTMGFTKRLGDLLTEVGMLTADQLSEALAEQKRSGGQLGKTLVKMGYLTEENLARALEHQLFVPYVDLDHAEVDPKVLEVLPVGMMEEDEIFPFRLQDKRLHVAVVDPLNHTTLDTIKRITDYELEVYIATPTALKGAIQKHCRTKLDAKKALAEMQIEITRRSEADKNVKEEQKVKKAQDEAHAVIRLVESLLSRAIVDRASDIHIEPTENDTKVRYRVDGVLEEVMSIPREIQSDIITRLKVVGGMDITEHRHPQDGHYEAVLGDRAFDLRLNCFPGVWGEKMVIRLLDKQATHIGLDRLDFSLENAATIRSVIELPYGLFLVTGPTGSGKTTTLYSVLYELNKPAVNILTVEDPVEYRFSSITQMQVNPKIHLSFADGLRAALRQDPDIILVGEIRDKETLQTAIQASMTGHLVFSTLHTNDALSAVARMDDMGIKPSLIFAGLIGVMAQRLARKLCQSCKEPYSMRGAEIRKRGFRMESDDEVTLYRAKGCQKCGGKGYSGRIGIHEIVIFTDEVQGRFLAGESISKIKRALLEPSYVPPGRRLLANESPGGTKPLIQGGMQFLDDDGLLKALEGKTSLEEVVRVVQVRGE